MKKRKYIENKWTYWLKDIYFRGKDLKIASDLILSNLNYYGYKIPEFYAECRINDYTISSLSVYVYDKINCLNFTDINVNLSTKNLLPEIYVEEIISDLKRLIKKFLSFNSLMLTSRIVVNGVSININGNYDLFQFTCLFKERLKKEGWISDTNSWPVEEYYFPSNPYKCEKEKILKIKDI